MRGHIASKWGKYYIVVDITDESGKRKKKWFSGPDKSGYLRKRDAEKALPDILSSLNKGTYVETKKDLTFGTIMKEWLEDKKTEVKHGTWKSYAWLVNNHIIPKLGKTQMAKLKPEHLHKFYHVTLLKEAKLSVGSIKKVHVIIMDALNRAVQWGKIPQNVATTVKLPQGKKVKFQVWNEYQLRTFLDAAANDQYFIAFELAASTGMRKSEILGLLREDVDLNTKIISVRQAYTISENGYDFDDTKSDSSERSISLFPNTVELLKQHFEKQNEQKNELKKIYTDYGLVVQTAKGTPVNQRNLMRNYYRIVKEIQNEHPDFPKIRFHDLRHTHATLLLKAGIHPKIVQERLGHSSINVTLDTYSHVLPNMQEAVLRSIGNSITGTKIEAENPLYLDKG
ncbi:site-specific integrase [Paenibacillus alvei]|uniref:tyrosine-type recombinase/integrase n=2 Tax=Paenibacillus alvei TaxID=44250 RepID=UPI0013D9427C|nr:tyrosine-type recombinase/integrase [Paenibacillus alvei]MCY9734681.1 site-specific integrase [Paenibacillus alvei]NEZ40314.1 tyrosine-type recombinase/integrase [Paenibacillus alvei]